MKPQPLRTYLFGMCLNEMTVDDVLLAWEFWSARDVNLLKLEHKDFDSARDKAITEHFLEELQRRDMATVNLTQCQDSPG